MDGERRSPAEARRFWELAISIDEDNCVVAPSDPTDEEPNDIFDYTTDAGTITKVSKWFAMR